MADETATDTKPVVKPFPLPDLKTTPDPEPKPLVVEDEPKNAAQRLRAFEDDVFGVKVSRINGAVERGIGSPYADMTPHQKAHYAALERLVTAEKDMADASAALAAAEAAHEAASNASDAAAQAMDETA